MTKQELILALAQSEGMEPEEAAVVVHRIFHLIAQQLEMGESVKIRNFGTFKLSHRKEKVVTNPTTGETTTLPPRSVPVFVASEGLRKSVKQVGAHE